MDIETTPKSIHHDETSQDSRLSSVSRRHTPTARMSERKRNLFDKKYSTLALIIDDDVDLGPMSPLQYSSSPTESHAHAVPFDRNAKQTDFSNLFPATLKPGACLSPITSLASGSPLFSTEKQMLLLEESASSTAIPIQPDLTRVTEDHPSSSNLLPLPVLRAVQEKTPSERMINCQELRVSFKKSLILGDMTPTLDEEQRQLLKNHQKRSYSTSVLTEKNAAAVDSPREKMAKLDAVDLSRARTSLTFDGVAIPTNRFYAHQTNDDENRAPRIKRYSLPLPNNNHNKSRSSNSSSTRRSREFGVAHKGCSHKIKKPSRAPVKVTLKKKVELAVLEDQNQHREKEKEIPLKTIDSAQTTRIHEIFKNIKNPLEMSRPLFFSDNPDDRFHIADDEEEAAVAVAEGEAAAAAKRKFFKSGGTTGAKSYKLTNNVVATVEGGRITLPKFPVTVAQSSGAPVVVHTEAEFSLVEDEFGSEFEEVTDIISKLASDGEWDAFRNRLPYETTDPETMQRQSELLEMLIAHQLCTEENFRVFIAEPEQHKEEMNRILDSLVEVPVPVPQPEVTPPSAVKPTLFPIFYPNRQPTKRKVVALGVERTSPSRKVWKRIGDTQLQIDAGQKRFGATYCAECDLLYSVHEPEDELMHERFHSSLSVLRFSGWKQETVVREVERWGVSGRVLAVPWNEHKAKLLRVNGVLAVLDREMGCPSVEWRSKTIVYLAVAQNTILGVCVAECKYEANRLVTEGGVDYFSEENYPVWCGVSRIWVAAPYRNQGVATELITAVRAHFTVGRTLSIEEVAFQSPTEAGKLLGQKLTGRRDFLVYP